MGKLILFQVFQAVVERHTMVFEKTVNLKTCFKIQQPAKLPITQCPGAIALKRNTFQDATLWTTSLHRLPRLPP